MRNTRHPFTELLGRCLLAALCTGALSALLLTLTVLLLAAGHTESSPPAWP